MLVLIFFNVGNLFSTSSRSPQFLGCAYTYMQEWGIAASDTQKSVIHTRNEKKRGLLLWEKHAGVVEKER